MLKDLILRNSQPYLLETDWHISAPLSEVWPALIDVPAWPQWWPGMTSAICLNHLPKDQAGVLYAAKWQGRLPYAMHIEAQIQQITHHDVVTAGITGDIRGICQCHVHEKKGGTSGRISLSVSPTKTWMKCLTPVLKPVFEKNHYRLMNLGLAGLQSYILEKKH